MKKQRLKKKSVVLLMFLICILFIFTFNITSSRYLSQLDAEAGDVVAVPILNLTNSNFSYKLDNMLPGYVNEMDFYVSNYDDLNSNEILMKYYFNVQIDGEIPIKLSMTREDGTDIILDSSGKSQEEELPYDVQKIVKYHVKLEWDKSDNDYKYAEKNIKLNVDLMATQVVEGS